MAKKKTGPRKAARKAAAPKAHPGITKGFGERLARARDAMGWTQHELGVEIGVQAAQVSHWESGGQLPAMGKHFDAIVRALRVAPGKLLFGDDDSYVEREPHPVWLAFEETDTFRRLRPMIPEEMLRWEARAPWGRGGVTVEDLERRIEDLARIYQRSPPTERELDEARSAREARERAGKPIHKLKPV